MPSAPEVVAAEGELAEGACLRRTVAGRDVAIFKVGGELFAIDANCPHRRGPLDEGTLEGHTVVCPWHGWKFDLRTGKSPSEPGQVLCHEAKIEDGKIVVCVK